MKIKVLWIIDSLGHGGAEKMSLTILEKLDREKFSIRVCALQVKAGNPTAKEIEKLGIPVDFVDIPVLRHPLNIPKLISYIRKHNPDVIHTQLEFADTLGSFAAKILGKPSISTQHTIGNPQHGSAYWRSQLTWFSLRYFCTKVITVSDDSRNFYIKNAKIPNNKILTVYNGIDVSSFKKLEDEILIQKRESFKISERGVAFTTVAILREPKGIQFMIQALPLILREVPEFYYLVAGDGEYGESLKRLASSLGVSEHVIFLGQRKDINEILQASDCFVLPTLTEALPTVLIEAMASRKAIIASAVGGVPEMVINEKNGVLVEAGDVNNLAKECIRLAKNKSLRDAMANEGYKVFEEKFNVVKLIDNLSKIYIEAVNNGKRN